MHDILYITGPILLLLFTYPRSRHFFGGAARRMLSSMFKVHRPLTDAEVDSLLNRLTPAQFEDLANFVSADYLSDDAEFWRQTHQLSGMRVRLRDMWLRLMILQVCWKYNIVSAQDALYVWKLWVFQCWFTFMALNGWALSKLIEDYPHTSARTALMLYFRGVHRINTLCVTEDAPEEMVRLYQLL